MLNNKEFDDIIWTGDINADFMRGTRFVCIIDDFINEMNICKSWDRYYVDVTHANEYNGVTFTSTLDHFFWNKTFGDFVTDAGVIHLSDNPSDHSPVYYKFKIPLIYNRATPTSNARTKAIPRWKRLLTFRSRITSMTFKLPCRIPPFVCD